MIIGKYVVQLPGLEVGELKKRFHNIRLPSGQVTALNDVGILAVTEKCKESAAFLIENLNHPQLEVQRIAIDYLGDFPSDHPLLRDAYAALSVVARKTKKTAWSEGLSSLLAKSLDKTEKRLAI